MHQFQTDHDEVESRRQIETNGHCHQSIHLRELVSRQSVTGDIAEINGTQRQVQTRPDSLAHFTYSNINSSSISIMTELARKQSVAGSKQQLILCHTSSNFYIHTFNGPFSGTTEVSRYQKGKTNPDFTKARDNEWQWHQVGHMQVCTLL